MEGFRWCPQGPNPKTPYSTSEPRTAPFAGDVQARRMQDLTFSGVLRVHLKLNPAHLRKSTTATHFHSTTNNFLLNRWPKYCEVLHPGRICLDRARFQSNKQDIESISGTPNTNQTDEDNAFLQTSKERETTQRPEYTRGKKILHN